MKGSPGNMALTAFLSGCVMLVFILLCFAYPAVMIPVVLVLLGVLLGATFIGLAASSSDTGD